MRGNLIVTGALLVMLGSTACSASHNADSKQSAASQPGTLVKVTLPDQPGPLVDAIAQRVRAARSVHAGVVVAAADGGSELSSMSGDVRTDSAKPMASLTLLDSSSPTAKTNMHAIVIDDSIYSRVDGQQDNPNKPWTRLSRQDLKSLSDPSLANAAKLLTLILDQVDSALREVTADTGLNLVRNGTFDGPPATDTLDGTPMHRYQGTTQTATMAAGDPAYRQMNADGLKQLSWTLWADDYGLPRKFVVTLDSHHQKAQHTAVYTAWGKPVTIEAPPKDKVTTITDQQAGS